jgi:hypothetical protein
VNAVVETSVPEKILLAAYELDRQGQSPFSAETLIVTCWQKFPRAFGLKGYADQYPDSNKVLTSIMGEKGLARRGWLGKMGQKMYDLTKMGRDVARNLLHEEAEAAPPAAASNKLSRDQEKFLLGLLASTALEKFQQGLKMELNFGDACRFWGITENLRGTVLDARLEKMRAGLKEVNEFITDGGIDLSNGRYVAGTDVKMLQKVDEYLTDRFGRHLTLLRNRAEQKN